MFLWLPGFPVVTVQGGTGFVSGLADRGSHLTSLLRRKRTPGFGSPLPVSEGPSPRRLR